MSCLDIAALSKRFARTEVLRDVALNVEPEEVVGLIGPNGSGKSTLIHSVAGIVEPDAGEILINSVAHTKQAAKEDLGFVPDDLQLPVYLTGAEYVDLIRSLRSRFDVAAAGRLLTLLGIQQDLGKLIGHYSHGMKKKLQIATTLACNPRLLLLDEPFSGLDPQTHMILDVMIREFRSSGRGVLVSTHDLTFAQRYFDRVYVLHEGRVIVSGSPADICDDAGLPSLSDVFVKITANGRDPRLEAKTLMGEIYA